MTGRYQLDLERRRVGLSAGWEILSEQEENRYIRDLNAQEIPVERHINGWFVESRWPFSGRAALTAGLRVERIERSALAAGEFGRPAFDEADVVWSVNPKVSGAWFVRPADARGWTKIRFGAGTGIKPPTRVRDRVHRQSRPQAGAQPQLRRRRRARLRRIGVRRRRDVVRQSLRRSDRHRGQRLRAQASIESDNIANATAKGLEIGARWRARARTFGARGLHVARHRSPGRGQRRARSAPRRTSSATRWSAGRATRPRWRSPGPPRAPGVLLDQRPRRDDGPRAELRVVRVPESGLCRRVARRRRPHRPVARGLRACQEPVRSRLRGSVRLSRRSDGAALVGFRVATRR